ncbi:MAG: DEAD/DEAH box helicase [Deltaproteobacteria bacterium]|nr:DEAD/DEAH box helicase [Deltaproteobacteria bacterium]
MTTFADLGLRPELLRAVQDAEYDTPTPIQAQAIPVALRGTDLLGCAQTGTGKTAGFLLPILQRLAQGKRGRLRALVLTPTRELAAQIGESARTYGKYLPVRSTVVFGGVGLRPQEERLHQGVDLLIATPGRLLDHLERGNLEFSALEVLVLDEADRMLDMGFLPDVRRILRTLPTERQTLLFSATMPQEIEILAYQTLKTPVVIDVGRRATPVSTVRQVIYPVEPDQKRDLLCHLLKHGNMKHVLVFTRTKVRAERLARHLAQIGRRVEALHGDKSQGARTQALDGFRNGRVEVLVATDIAARGLDVEGISHVVNFDVPNIPEDYIHRIGRTARAEATGDAISLVSSEELDCVRAIEHLIGITIPRRLVVGFEPGAETVRRFTQQPAVSRAARVASGAIRHFGPRNRGNRHRAWA